MEFNIDYKKDFNNLFICKIYDDNYYGYKYKYKLCKNIIDNQLGGMIEEKKRFIVKFNAKKVIKSKSKYIKISQNQLQILDALLNDGSQKKYLDSDKKFRYSEHSGLFDFDNSKLERIVVSGKTTREDRDDSDILLPHNMSDAIDYEYMFHTHPPTPYSGARAIGGILYEFPSISDLYHFAYHYNEGHIQGSMIIAPEGIYIIKMKENIKYIDYPSNKIANKMEKINYTIQEKSILKYGTDFSNHRQKIFYDSVAQDKTYIKMYNKMVKKFFNPNMIIFYKPREYDRKINKWIIKNLYIKVEPVQIEYS